MNQWRNRANGFPFWAISSAGRAPGSQSGGQGFDPPMVHQRSTPPPWRWGASLVDRVCFGERTPSAAAEPNGRIAMIALRQCVNPPIPGGMNVRWNHDKNDIHVCRTFRFRIPYAPPLGNNTNTETNSGFVLFFSNDYFGIRIEL